MYAKAQMFLPRTAQSSAISDFVASDLAAGEASIVYLSTDSKLASVKTTVTASDLTAITDNMHSKFQVMWRKYNTSDVILTTPELSLAELVNAKIVVDGAGTAQVVTITPEIPGTPAIGDTYHLTIIDTTPGTANLNKYNYEVVNTTGSIDSVADLIDAFVDLINADTTVNVTAADATSDMTLTGDTKQNHFRVAYDGDAPATIEYTTDLEPDTLSKAQIQQMEKDMKSHGEGITNTIWFPKDWTSEVSDTTYYDNMGIFQFKLNKPAKHGMNASNYEDYTLYIAEAANIDLVDNLIVAWNAAH
jgi:hypothetical protein